MNRQKKCETHSHTHTHKLLPLNLLKGGNPGICMNEAGHYDKQSKTDMGRDIVHEAIYIWYIKLLHS